MCRAFGGHALRAHELQESLVKVGRGRRAGVGGEEVRRR